MMKDVVLRIAALFSYCGGPLFIADLVKPRFGTGMVFCITFLPVGLMVLGALCLDETHNRWASMAITAGRMSVYIVFAMHLYAVWRFVDGVRVPDQRLHYIGIAIGVAWSAGYLRAARRRREAALCA